MAPKMHFNIVIAVALIASVNAKCQWTSEGEVQCNLKILDFRRNSTSASMLVPSPGLGEVKKLKVLCSDVFFFESQLRSDHLGSVDGLTDLEISYCKLRTLPPRTFVGLGGLATLVIHTHNEDWTSLQMAPDYESLVGLERLQSLDMQLNNLHQIPPGFFCPLKNLGHIELSFNAIKDLNDLSISRAKDIKEEFRCSIPAQSLALRHNGLVTVTPRALDGLSASLRHLDLSHNQVDVLVEAAFAGLTALEGIDLSFNRLAALPPKIFSATPNLLSLVLGNNTLGTIDIDVFANLTKLQTLNMSGNNLDENWIRPGIFDGLHSLVVLDLSGNHIARLDQGLLDDLAALQVLNLGHNKIHTIVSNSFLNQANLHILNLRHNQLESVQRQTLTGLSLLNTLLLDRNKIHTLHSASLRNCTALTSLGLSHNFLTQTPEAVHSSSLQLLDISSNLLGVLKRESLQGMPKLKTLNLGNNELSRIGEGAFKEVPGLEELDLSQNKFMSLERDTLKDLKQLKALDLSRNQLEDVNGLFTQQSVLESLNLSSNHLSWFDYAFIPPSLEVLDIHSNNIDSLGNYYAMRDNYNLKFVDASINVISSLHLLSILPRVIEINLSNNTISKIAPQTFLGKEHLAIVHLERNRLESLEMASLMVSLGPHKRPPQFFLAGNPLRCDCNLQWFHQMATAHLQLPFVDTAMSQMYPEIPDLEQVHCHVLNTTEPSQTFTRSLTLLEEKDFLCPYLGHCLNFCRCCDFLACDCFMKCPDECQCFHNQVWSANVVQCSNRSLNHVPSLVPMDVTSLHLSGNNLTRLTQNMFLGRTRLRKILLSSSNVVEIDNATFSALDHLEVIDLGYNQLKQLLGHEFREAVSLRELYLHHNQLVSIEPNTFKLLTQLSVLRLDGNLLIEFPIWTLSANKYLNSLTLSSNWWNCECAFVRKFRMFIDTLGPAVVKDSTSIACNSDHDKRIGQSKCQSMLPNQHFFATETSSQIYTVPVVLGVIGICLALALVTMLVICGKDHFRFWLYAKYGIRIEFSSPPAAVEEDEEKPILFDALVLYSNKDNDPYVSEFCQNLEPAYRLCLLHRDLAGIYTSEAFKSALEASKRHIVLLSRSFFVTEWQHFQDHLPDYKKLIVVKLDLDAEDNSEQQQVEKSEEKKFLSTMSSKVLSWSNKPRFWQSIRYYLPDPPKLPTKEGGAELDVSGVWTFSGEINAVSPNPTVATVIAAPKRCSATTLLAHQDSGIYDSQSNFALTRSCGTNAVVHHQRSSSALVETIRHVERGSHHHQRSKSYLYPQDGVVAGSNDLQRPPTPPAKVGKMQRPREQPTYASPPNILLQLASVSPELMASLNATMTTPLETSTLAQNSSSVKMISPVVRAKLKDGNSPHQRSVSLLADVSHQQQQQQQSTPKTTGRFQGHKQGGHYAHGKSMSVSQTPPCKQKSLVLSNSHLKLPNSHAKLSSNSSHYQHSRSVSMLESHQGMLSAANYATPKASNISAIRLEDLGSRKILNMSTSQLHHLAGKKMTPRGASYHQRSSSTPYEGFVL